MNLVILILVEVQASGHTGTSFHPSSLPSLIPLPSKLDNVREGYRICIARQFKDCAEMLKNVDHELFAQCIVDVYAHCHDTHFMYPEYDKLRRGFNRCIFKHRNTIARADCLFQFYERNVKQH